MSQPELPCQAYSVSIHIIYIRQECLVFFGYDLKRFYGSAFEIQELYVNVYFLTFARKQLQRLYICWKWKRKEMWFPIHVKRHGCCCLVFLSTFKRNQTILQIKPKRKINSDVHFQTPFFVKCSHYKFLTFTTFRICALSRKCWFPKIKFNVPSTFYITDR